MAKGAAIALVDVGKVHEHGEVAAVQPAVERLEVPCPTET
jgi:hypothetical protein